MASDRRLSEGQIVECKLIGGTFSDLLQLFLFLAALSGLLLKRFREKPRRTFQVWFYDVSKQGYGALFVHLWNMVLSIVLKTENYDECAMYFVLFFMDMMLGMLLVWAMVRAVEFTAFRYGISSLAVSGDYGVPPNQIWFFRQLGAYILILLVVKTLISALVIVLENALSSIGAWLFSPVAEYPKVELVIVMIICPWLLNGIQFWMMDNILMKTPTKLNVTARSGRYNYLQSGRLTDVDSQVTVDFSDMLVPGEPSWMAVRSNNIDYEEGIELNVSPSSRNLRDVVGSSSVIYPNQITLV